MTYTETLDWMFAQLPMYQQKGKIAYNSKLDGILTLTNHLDNPQKQFKSIHVAGTNGKGSSSHMLASILQEAGYRVGLYTSPHLKDFRERIRINGKPVSETYVVNFIAAHKGFIEARSFSFFEMTVGMAFDYFAKENVDVAVIEVGLGGRLDSTNIIIPEITLITNIGYDHMDILGDTLEKIAVEKAGVIKQHVPVVVSEYQPDIALVFLEKANEKMSEITFASQKKLSFYPTSLLGDYQKRNIKGVLVTLDKLKNFKVDEAHIKNGLQNVVMNTGLQGRWQLLRKNPKVICDTAHNLEGLSLVLAQLLKENYKTLHFVLGFVKEKDLDAILPLFPTNACYYFCKPNIPRGLNAEILLEQAKKYNLKGRCYASVMDAYKAVNEQASKADLIYIGGSNFTVAEVL
ncbi:bifunctional folylpolyglutamate synthase/dihydrofolate synthase [Maribacter antarcticus]|uniref:bifunctional folylpolyglutamate synthase/dihydrofolate synthase n=1 Tax=Maribacter antarcticus TaxID=505250 RepID=UPI00047C2C09|nr:folylpolyglutamate synthase/dihydrofolate synthase family protein [Maribacter antarcticus]